MADDAALPGRQVVTLTELQDRVNHLQQYKGHTLPAAEVYKLISALKMTIDGSSIILEGAFDGRGKPLVCGTITFYEDTAIIR